MKKPLVFHSVLFAASPVLFLFSHNIAELGFDELFLPLAISVVASVIIFSALSFLYKDRAKAGLLTTLALALFFLYGIIYAAISGLSIAGIALARPRALILASVMIVLILGFLLFRTKRNLGGATKMLNIMSAALVAMSVFTILSFQMFSGSGGSAKAGGAVSGKDGGKATKASSGRPKPDIYYIILDAHVSPKTMKSMYKHDPSEFVDAMKRRGFYLAEDSHSNYDMTFLSLPSSLNMKYVNFFTKEVGAGSSDRRLAYEMIRNSEVSKFLRKEGYKFVHFKSGWGGTDKNPYADIVMKGTYLNEFSTSVIQNTMLMPFVRPAIVSDKRNTILYELKKLKTVPRSVKGPKFVFAHVLAPHPPYVIGANGEAVDQNELALQGSAWKHFKGYLDQAKYVDKQAVEIADAIIKQSSVPPVIIFQGDHGSTTFSSFNKPNQKFIDERMSILNMYYLPGADKKALYPAISPVNSFRVVLNEYFDAGLPLLPDKTYFSNYEQPYAFKDVTDKLR